MSQIYVRSDNASDIVFQVKLRIPEWKVLFAIDGDKDVDSLAGFLGMPASDIGTTLEKLQNLQLVLPANGQAIPMEAAGMSGFEVATPEDTAAAEVEIPDLDDLADESAISDFEDVADALGVDDDDDDELSFGDSLAESLMADSGPESSGIDEILSEAAEGDDDDADATEDFDQLIGNLLEEEAESSATAASTPAIELEEESPAVADIDEDDFDLGSIFQDDLDEDDQASVDSMDSIESLTATVDEDDPIDTVSDTLTGLKRNKTVLVVDDSVVIRKMVEIALENESYEIVAVATGKDALTYLDENDPDVIILDIMLSDVNGLDVLKAIKASKQIPVVMLSAKDTPRETSKARELGADDFIPKPFKDEELVSKIKELING